MQNPERILIPTENNRLPYFITDAQIGEMLRFIMAIKLQIFHLLVTL